MNDIIVEEPLQISSVKDINGNNKILSANSPQGWDSFYVLQFYKTTGSVKDVVIKDGDAAIYVNGSIVELTGTVDVSGNEFGGIEVSQGGGVTIEPKLTVNGTLTFTDINIPAIWIDGEITNGTDDNPWVIAPGFESISYAKEDEGGHPDKDQVWFKVK